MRLRGGAVWAVGSLLAATACGPVAHPTLDELDALPGLPVTYPGSVVRSEHRIESDWNIMAKNPAVISQDACTPDEALTVRTWFDDHLSRLGWGRDPGVWQADGLGDASWSKGDLRFHLVLMPPDLLPDAKPPAGCVTRMGTRLW